MNDIKVSRALVERVVVFLEQYKEKLESSNYPPHQYRAISIEDIVEQLRSACHD